MRATPTRRAGRREWAVMIGALAVTAALVGLLVARIAAANRTVRTLPATSNIVGHAAPDFTLMAWTGQPAQPGQQSQPIHLAALKGHPVMLNFWASWCEPCQGEAPLLAAASRTYMPRGVVFIGIAYDTTREDGTGFLSRYGITYACGPDTTTATATAYGVTGIPDTVFIDRSGIVAHKIVGPLTQASLAAGIQALLR